MAMSYDVVIVDGTQGVVIVDPDDQALGEYERRRHQFDLERHRAGDELAAMRVLASIS